MATKRNIGITGKAREMWESDTSKAIATVIAVLLIPGAVIAWNYNSNGGEINGEGSSTTSENGNMVTDENSDTEDNASEATAGTQTDETGEISEDGQDSAEVPDAIGGINVLPATGSKETYVVQTGDTIYSISQEICGDDSYFLANMRKHYLKAGSTIEIECK